MIDGIDKSPLAHIDTRILLLGFVVTILVALWIAYKYRDSYKVSQMLKVYGVFSAIFTIVYLVLSVKVVIILGILLMGLVVLGFRSNHYFYH